MEEDLKEIIDRLEVIEQVIREEHKKLDELTYSIDESAIMYKLLKSYKLNNTLLEIQIKDVNKKISNVNNTLLFISIIQMIFGITLIVSLITR